MKSESLIFEGKCDPQIIRPYISPRRASHLGIRRAELWSAPAQYVVTCCFIPPCLSLVGLLCFTCFRCKPFQAWAGCVRVGPGAVGSCININIYWLTGWAMQLRELFCLLCSTNRRPDALSASWSQLWWIMVYTLLLLAASYIHGLWIDPIMYLEICPNIGHILRTKYLNYAVEELWFVHNRNIAIVYKPSMKFQLKESHNVVQIKYTWNSSWKGSHNTATQLQVRGTRVFVGVLPSSCRSARWFHGGMSLSLAAQKSLSISARSDGLKRYLEQFGIWRIRLIQITLLI